MQNGVLLLVLIFGGLHLGVRISDLHTIVFLARPLWILGFPSYYLVPWGLVFLSPSLGLLLSDLLVLVVIAEHSGCLVVWSVSSVDRRLVLTLVSYSRSSCGGNKTFCLTRLWLCWLCPDDIVHLGLSPWLTPTISFVVGSSQAEWKCTSSSCDPWIFHTCFQWGSVSISLGHELWLLAPSPGLDNFPHASSIVGRRKQWLCHLALGRILVLVMRRHNILWSFCVCPAM